MTGEEFEARVALFQRGANQQFLLIMGVLVGGLVAGGLLANWADGSGTTSANITAVVVLFIVAAHPFVLWRWLGWRLQRRFHLLCPTCRRCLVGLGQQTESTGHCKFCGTHVVASERSTY